MDGTPATWTIGDMRIVLCTQHARNERSVLPHRHEHTEWHFAVAGGCGFDIGTETLALQGGDLLAVAAGTPHRLRIRRPGEWLIQVIIATVPESAEDADLLQAFLSAGTHGLVHVGSERHAFFAGLERDLASTDRFRRRAASLRFTALLCELVAGGGGGGHPGVAAALALMRSRIRAPDASRLTLAELAAAAGCSRSLLVRHFRSEVGASPLAHFLALRLELAADLLRQGGRAVHEVAAACGFADPYHFSRCFRRHFGKPPSAWKPE